MLQGLDESFTAANVRPESLSDAQSIADLITSGQNHQRRELIVVDEGVENAQALVDDFLSYAGEDRHFDVVLLHSNSDGLRQISAFLSSGATYDAMHVLSHGDTGQLRLGNTRLDLESVDARAEEISQWAAALTTNADILLYGCNLGASNDGIVLIGKLAALTGADIAASDDLT